MRTTISIWVNYAAGRDKFTIGATYAEVDVVLKAYMEDRYYVVRNKYGPITPVENLPGGTFVKGPPYLIGAQMTSFMADGVLPVGLMAENVRHCSRCSGMGWHPGCLKNPECKGCKGTGLFITTIPKVPTGSPLEQYLESLR